MNTTVLMTIQVFCVVLLAASAASAPVMTSAPRSYFLSWRGKYVEVAASGKIRANGEFGDEASQFHIDYPNGATSLRAQSTAFTDKFIVFMNGELRGDVPTGDNDVFEIVELGAEWKALRAPSSSLGSGLSSEESDLDANPTECYIGFSEDTGAPSCYESTDHMETRLFIVPHYT